MPGSFARTPRGPSGISSLYHSKKKYFLNQNIFQLLVANGDVAADEVAEAALDFLLSQANEVIITQDDRRIALNHDPETTGDNIVAQDGSFITTQDGQPLITEQAS